MHRQASYMYARTPRSILRSILGLSPAAAFPDTSGHHPHPPQLDYQGLCNNRFSESLLTVQY